MPRKPPAEPVSPHDLQRAEAARAYYRRNFRDFAAQQLKIRPLQGGALIPLVLTESQDLCVQRVEEQRARQGYVRGVALKPRQSGFSTLWEGLLLHLAIFNENISTLLVAADDKSTKAIFRMVQLMVQQLDDDVRPLIRYNNKEEFDFADPDRHSRGGLNSRMEFQTAKNAIAGTGTTRQALHCSEVGKWSEDFTDDLATSLMPSIPRLPGTYLIMESTAFEGGDYFREKCEEAEAAEIARFKGDATGGGSEFFFHFAPWWLDSKNSAPLIGDEKIELTAAERELQRYAQKGFPKEYPHLRIGPHTITNEQFKFRRLESTALKGERNFDQEYPRNPQDAWISRDNWVFDRRALAELRKELSPPREFVEIDNGPRLLTKRKSGNVFEDQDYIAIWKRPEQGVTYDIGVDSAMGGDDGDWTYGAILRRDTLEQVGEYHKHILPVDAAKEFYWLGKVYNTAQLIVEMNLGPGIVLNHELEAAGYPYLYTWRNFDRIGQALTSYAGWATNHKSKQVMISIAADRVAHTETIIRSRVLWEQLRWYIDLGDGVYRAHHGHDDGVMGYGMAVIGGKHEGHVAPGETPPQQDQAAEPSWLATHDDRNRAQNNKRIARELRELQGMR